ncbi:MAG TPA: Maf family protein [Chloroflexia bacterium]|nr:Maf family protein [Chloroflexia bacterium]
MLILASGSPRRIDLIQRVVAHYESITSDIEERGSGSYPPFDIPLLNLAPPFPLPLDQDPRLWAWRKASDVALLGHDKIAQGTVILGADTVVVGPGRTLGKPTSRDDARGMLRLLRGGPHYVVTGFVLLRVMADETPTLLHMEAVISTVFMRDYSNFELEGYVASDEPYDKAGAYALQGEGGKLVSSTEGCINNVVGLPVCRVRRALVAAGEPVKSYPYGGFCEHCALVD